MSDYAPLNDREAAAWRVARHHDRVRAELLIGAMRAHAVLRLTDALGATLQVTRPDHLQLAQGFAARRAEGFATLSRYAGANRMSGRRFAGALHELGLLRR